MVGVVPTVDLSSIMELRVLQILLCSIDTLLQKHKVGHDPLPPVSHFYSALPRLDVTELPVDCVFGRIQLLQQQHGDSHKI